MATLGSGPDITSDYSKRKTRKWFHFEEVTGCTPLSEVTLALATGRELRPLCSEGESIVLSGRSIGIDVITSAVA